MKSMLWRSRLAAAGYLFIFPSECLEVPGKRGVGTKGTAPQAGGAARLPLVAWGVSCSDSRWSGTSLPDRSPEQEGQLFWAVLEVHELPKPWVEATACKNGTEESERASRASFLATVCIGGCPRSDTVSLYLMAILRLGTHLSPEPPAPPALCHP